MYKRLAQLGAQLSENIEEAGALWIQVETKDHFWPALFTAALAAVLLEMMLARALSTGRSKE